MIHATISHNKVLSSTAPNNGAIQIAGATASLTMTNSIIANTEGDADCAVASGAVVDNGHNLIEDGGCITQESSLSGDPQLDGLSDNGGGPLTHALIEGSIAIDTAGSDTCLPVDQIGTARPLGDQCDIGAFEGAISADIDNTLHLPLLLKP